jgi:trehalose 6-phosphate synthase
LARLVVVSNRLSNPRERILRAGGLSVAMREALRKYGGVWFGWSGEVAAETSSEPKIVASGRTTYATMDLSEEDYNAYYNGFSNSTLWPLFHYRLGLLEFRRSDWEGYQRVNARLAAALLPLLKPGDLIWVHDYHLIPIGEELRKLGSDHRIAFFLHTPFPAAAVFEALPGWEQLLDTFAAYDLVGFQTESDLRAFRDAMMMGGATPWGEDAFLRKGRATRTGAFPIGLDTEQFVAMAAKAATSEETQRLKDSMGGRSLIIGVDRLDYSKGLINRFAGFGQLLTRHPETRNKLTLLQIAPRSRGDVAQYRALRRALDSLAGRINAKFAEVDWVPLRYLNKTVARPVLAGYYRIARIGLVTPLRDGMNLVAKEYVAAQDPADPGVLVLSRFAGAARELTSALIVNPYDEDAIADALHAAHTMPLEERRERWEQMMAAIRENTITTWRERFLAALNAPESPAARPEPEPVARRAAALAEETVGVRGK